MSTDKEDRPEEVEATRAGGLLLFALLSPAYRRAMFDDVI